MKETQDILNIVKEYTQTGKPHALKALSFLGMISATVGSLDLTQITQFLPDNVSGWMLSAGLFAASLEKLVLYIGDILDNGVRDRSFKFEVKNANKRK